ncbi:hypothetical protein [Sphingobium sp.]|uniref:hypothetical protein n=1 Tax=Sphingobium sp. TaxID=1912891 RepID=UPI003BB6E9C2
MIEAAGFQDHESRWRKPRFGRLLLEIAAERDEIRRKAIHAGGQHHGVWRDG